MSLDFNKLAKEIHQGNVERGFYENPASHNTRLMLIISELCEALEADRKGRYFQPKKYQHDKSFGDLSEVDLFTHNIKDTFEDEIADTFIRLLDMAGYYNVSISKYIGQYEMEDEDTLFKMLKSDALYELTKKIIEIISISNGVINHALNAIIRCCKMWNIDLLWHVEQKLNYNKTREYKHGKKY